MFGCIAELMVELRPRLLGGKVSGENWAISWLCQVSSIAFEQTLITCLLT